MCWCCCCLECIHNIPPLNLFFLHFNSLSSSAPGEEEEAASGTSMASISVPNPVPSPTEDAENIRKAVQGWGTDEKALIDILGHRTAAQRAEIAVAYEGLYNETLLDRLHSELSGDFRSAMMLWTMDPAARDAKLANKALRKKGDRHVWVLIEVACASSPDHLVAVRKAYCSAYSSSLEEDVASCSLYKDPLKQLMLPAFSSCCVELVSRWMESLGSDGSCEVDVWPELQNLTGDVISRTAFSSSYLEGRRIFQLQAEQAERLMTCIQKIVIPGYMSLPTKNNRRMHQINKEIESILRGLIGKRIQAMKEGESTKDDLLGLLLEFNMRHTDQNGQSSLGMTLEEVIEECKLFYFAGMETTSVLLTWTMVVLSMHPEWQDRAREEVLGLFGKNKPEYEGLSCLKTVTTILYEVLRLYPPGIAFSRKTYKVMGIGGVTYPAGVVVELPVLFIHHDPDIWGSDVHEFRPERFAEGISKASKEPGAFLPFGWGPRICIGQNFALLEAKMALCMILQHFEFELAPSYTHAPHTVITLHPMHGAQIKLSAI